MRFGSVCSGIEAASVAWAPLGWRASFLAEVEDFPSAVLAHHHPNVPNHGDMTRFEEWPDHAIDLLVGGTPCQSFSVAGLRKGLDDERGNLMLVYGAIARRYRPKWLVWENVPGVLSSDSGRDFASLLGLLSGQRIEVPKTGWETAGVVPGIASAYGLAWRVLDAQFVRVDGFGRAVPQRRRRVFVVGYLGDWRRAAAVLLERESLSGNPAPRREPGERPAPTLSARTRGGGGLGTDFECDGGLLAFGGNNQSGPIEVATACRAKGGSGHGDFETETFVAESVAGTLGNNGKAAGTATGQDAANGMFKPSHFTRGKEDPDHGSVTHPLDTDGSSIGVFTQWRVRRLTPRECERLQGFPDGYTMIPGASKGGWRDIDETEDVEELKALGLPVRLTGNTWRVKDPDGPRYKALGNSMAVNVMRWIGTRIAMVEQIT